LDAESNPKILSKNGWEMLPSTVAGITTTWVLTFFYRKKSVSIIASVIVCVAPTNTIPSKSSFSHVSFANCNSSGERILSSDLPKKQQPPKFL